MIYLHIRFHIPRSSVSLDITIKIKAKYGLCGGAVLLFYILLKNYHEGVAYVLISIMKQHFRMLH
jgi:hypothetical protein